MRGLCFWELGWEQQLITLVPASWHCSIQLDRLAGSCPERGHWNRTPPTFTAIRHMHTRLKVMGRRYRKTALKPKQPTHDLLWNLTLEKISPKARIPRPSQWWPVHHYNLRLYQLNVISPTCEWSSSSPGTPSQRRSEWPYRVTQQHSLPPGCIPVNSLVGSHMACILSQCKRVAPGYTHLAGRRKGHVNEAAIASLA